MEELPVLKNPLTPGLDPPKEILKFSMNICHPNGTTDKRFAMMRNWLDDCAKEHAFYCAKSLLGEHIEDAKTTLPTRVIYIPARGSPRIYVSGGRQAKFAALSYCWGPPDEHRFVTTRENLDELCSSLPMERVPQTIKDAITVTQALGLEYLWQVHYSKPSSEP